MKTKDILGAWSKNRNNLFMYQRYQSSPTIPCEVVGFHTEPAVNGRYAWERKPEQKLVEIRLLPSLAYWRVGDDLPTWDRDTRQTMRVSARYLDDSYYPTWQEYADACVKQGQARADKAEQNRQFTEEVEQVGKALCLKLTVEQGKYGQLVLSGDIERVVATLRDAMRFYETIAQEQGV